MTIHAAYPHAQIGSEKAGSKSRKRLIRNILLMATTSLALPLGAFAQTAGSPPDSPPSYAEITTGLGIGILYEPCIGNAPDNNLCDVYTTVFGDMFEDRGFTSARLRLDRQAFTDNSTGVYPEQSLTPGFFTSLDAVVDDLLTRNNNSFYVLISPKGLENGTVDDQDQMAKWWGEIAEHYKDYSHRLIFNLMNEPLIRAGEFQDLQSVTNLYAALTDAVRPTNPTRYLVYHRMHDEFMDGIERIDRTPFSETGPGASDFNHMDMDQIDHRGYLIFDAHFLGDEDDNGSGEGKRDERLRQMWEFREVTGYPVWSGAWNWGAWDTAWSETEVTELVDLMKAKGIPGTYLMFNSSNTSLYDGNTSDRDGDGINNEWTKSDYTPIITARNPIVWDPEEVQATTLYAPVHDGWIGSDNTAMLETKDMHVDSNATRMSFLKFDVGRLPEGEVTSATLRIKARTANGDTISLHSTTPDWDESSEDGNSVPALNWASPPTLNNPAIGTITVNSADPGNVTLDTNVNDHDWLDPQAYTDPSWYAFDVTTFISGNGTYSFALKGENGALTKFHTRDSDRTSNSIGNWKYYPRLEVTVAPSQPQTSPPAFLSDPIVGADGNEGTAYAGSLASTATDADGDALTFSKLSGPGWLNVSPDGTLSGTPGANNVGVNNFGVNVSAVDGDDTAVLTVTVEGAAPPPPPLPGSATNPAPADGADKVARTSDLSWAAGSDTDSFEVYFGRDPNALDLVSTQTATTYNPGRMLRRKTYYWRVDAVNATGTRTGDLWSFTTK